MPVLDVAATLRALGGDEPLPTGVMQVRYLTAPTVLAVTVEGAEARFSPVIEINITDGSPIVTVDVPATDERCYAVVTIDPTSGRTAGRYTSGPVAIPADAETLADLIPVDPATYQPSTDAVAAWTLIRDEVVGIRDEIESLAVTVAPDPDNPDLLILTYPAFMLAPDGTSIVLPIGV